MTERITNIPDLNKLVSLKQDFDYIIEHTSIETENAYFVALMSLQEMGYNLRDIMIFQELQEML